MSGGSMDYAYSHVYRAEFEEDTPLRRAFKAHLKLVAEAMHDIEWVDSADYEDGREEEAIRKCLSTTGEGEQILSDLRKLVEVTKELLKTNKGMLKELGEL